MWRLHSSSADASRFGVVNHTEVWKHQIEYPDLLRFKMNFCVLEAPQTSFLSVFLFFQIQIVHKNQAHMLMGAPQGRSFLSSILRRTRSEGKD